VTKKVVGVFDFRAPLKQERSDAAPRPRRKNTDKVDRQIENVVIGRGSSTTGKVLTESVYYFQLLRR
jgi:hypothetical protein